MKNINYIFIGFVIILILIILIILNYKYNNNNNNNNYNIGIESFDDFSPYINNLTYPYLEQKKLDSLYLSDTLKKWETPFNTHNEGYYNAEPNKIPPLVPLYSYLDKKEVKFPVKDI